MPKFAHLSDIHIGAFRQPELKQLLSDSFDEAIQRCIDEKVEFVVMAGDIFDSNIPDLGSVKRATRKIHEARERGIRFYVIYGSHDFSPNYSSIVDVLESAGLFTKLERSRTVEGRLTLKMVHDQSGVALCGLSGKKLSLDKADYEVLDRLTPETEPGFKIFVFHAAVEELKPGSLAGMSAIPAAYLPEGFGYYAGGHVHDRSLTSIGKRKHIAYPGPLFATDFRDLEPLANGEERGFYLVDFDHVGVTKVDFVPIHVADIVEITCSADAKTSRRVQEELIQSVRRADVKGKVVLLKVQGQMASGKTSDIDFGEVRRMLLAMDPICVLPNYSRLSSKEQVPATKPPQPVSTTEREAFAGGIGSVPTHEPNLRGDEGVELAITLLKALKEEKRENETKAEYISRTENSGLSILGVKADP